MGSSTRGSAITPAMRCDRLMWPYCYLFCISRTWLLQAGVPGQYDRGPAGLLHNSQPKSRARATRQKPSSYSVRQFGMQSTIETFWQSFTATSARKGVQVPGSRIVFPRRYKQIIQDPLGGTALPNRNKAGPMSDLLILDLVIICSSSVCYVPHCFSSIFCHQGDLVTNGMISCLSEPLYAGVSTCAKCCRRQKVHSVSMMPQASTELSLLMPLATVHP
jgi:hypothetical protein